MAKIGEQIRKARENAGLTQQQLGEKMGVSSALIRHYESGRRTPKPKTVRRFADALGVTVDFLCIDPETYRQAFRSIGFPSELLSQIEVPPDFTIEELVKLGKIEEALILAKESWLNSMADCYHALNDYGRQIALERVNELTKIPEYQKEGSVDGVNPEENN